MSDRPDRQLPENRRWEDTTAAKGLKAELAEYRKSLHGTQRATSIQWGVIAAAIVAIGGVLTVMTQAGIFSMQNGWAFANKDDVKKQLDEVGSRIQGVEDKVDAMPEKLRDMLDQREARHGRH